MDDGTDHASVVLALVEPEGEDDVLDVFVNGLVVDENQMVFEVVEVFHGLVADGALQAGDVQFDGVVAEFVVDHGVELVLLGLLGGVRAQVPQQREVLGAVEAGEAALGFVAERTGVGVLEDRGQVDPVLNTLWCRAIVRFLFLFLALGRVAVRSYNKRALDYLHSLLIIGMGLHLSSNCRFVSCGSQFGA